MHYVPDQKDRPAAKPELDTVGLGFATRLPLDPGRIGDLPDWPRREPSGVERGSKALTWGVVLLLLGFVGLVLVSPRMGGHDHERPSYTD
jgi:hypothetical protein